MAHPPCACPSSEHVAACPQVIEARRALFAGLFDDEDGDRAVAEVGAVRLLDPGYRGDDPSARRFSLIETD